MIPFPELRTVAYDNLNFTVFPIVLKTVDYRYHGSILSCLGIATKHRYGDHIDHLHNLISYTPNLVLEVLIEGETNTQYFIHVREGKLSTTISTKIWIKDKKVFIDCPVRKDKVFKNDIWRISKIDNLLND